MKFNFSIITILSLRKITNALIGFPVKFSLLNSQKPSVSVSIENTNIIKDSHAQYSDVYDNKFYTTTASSPNGDDNLSLTSLTYKVDDKNKFNLNKNTLSKVFNSMKNHKHKLELPTFILSIIVAIAGFFSYKPINIYSTTGLKPVLMSTLLFAPLISYIPVLNWGLPLSRIGSYASIKSKYHRIGGILTLIVPLLFTIWEAITSTHVHPALFIGCIGMILTNVGFGSALIPTKIPLYDIPTVRAFAVGVLLALSFTSLACFFRFGMYASYEIIGKISAIISIYSVLYAWSDGLQHFTKYILNDYKPKIGKKWFIPFQNQLNQAHLLNHFKYIFIDCFYKQPSKEALQASVSPSNVVTASTTLLTALFAMTALIQTRYLGKSPSTIMQNMNTLYPHIVRWSCYNSLLAVVANNFGTFAGTLVIQKRVSQETAGKFNAIGLFVPVLNILAFCIKYPNAFSELFITSFLALPKTI
eukprot:gene8553-11559_t